MLRVESEFFKDRLSIMGEEWIDNGNFSRQSGTYIVTLRISGFPTCGYTGTRQQ